MLFTQTSLGAHTVNGPPIPQTFQLFGELALLAHLRLALLVISIGNFFLHISNTDSPS